MLVCLLYAIFPSLYKFFSILFFLTVNVEVLLPFSVPSNEHWTSLVVLASTCFFFGRSVVSFFGIFHIKYFICISYYVCSLSHSEFVVFCLSSCYHQQLNTFNASHHLFSLGNNFFSFTFFSSAPQFRVISFFILALVYLRTRQGKNRREKKTNCKHFIPFAYSLSTCTMLECHYQI